MRSGEAMPMRIWSKVSGLATGLAKLVSSFILNSLAPPLQGRGWGGAYPLGTHRNCLGRCPTPNSSPEGEGLDVAYSAASARSSRSEEHTSELQSLMRISYAVFCLKKKNKTTLINYHIHNI